MVQCGKSRLLPLGLPRRRLLAAVRVAEGADDVLVRGADERQGLVVVEHLARHVRRTVIVNGGNAAVQGSPVHHRFANLLLEDVEAVYHPRVQALCPDPAIHRPLPRPLDRKVREHVVHLRRVSQDLPARCSEVVPVRGEEPVVRAPVVEVGAVKARALCAQPPGVDGKQPPLEALPVLRCPAHRNLPRKHLLLLLRRERVLEAASRWI
mmetsp:Transcript_31290/g.89792  ORF Transcript_31290/g.89792 Transcript_31290/m.89792 type:complete len:209 (+) Transcript_31290:172-798(+)